MTNTPSILTPCQPEFEQARIGTATIVVYPLVTEMGWVIEKVSPRKRKLRPFTQSLPERRRPRGFGLYVVLYRQDVNFRLKTLLQFAHHEFASDYLPRSKSPTGKFAIQ